MKSRYFLAALLAIGAQNVLAAPGILSEPWHVTARDAHSAMWESVHLVTDEITDEAREEKHSYVEVATGLNYLNPISGKYEESQESFQITPQGDAVALKGQHQLR